MNIRHVLTLAAGVAAAALWSSLASGQSSIRFAVIGDYGVDNANQAAVATRVNAFNPDFIATTGDNTYLVGNSPAADFANWDRTQGKYYGNYIKLPAGSAYLPGSTVNRFFPVLGNHDWDEGVQSYSDYFELPTGATATSGERYYSFRQGPVELFMLSSDSREPDGRTAGSVQYEWARQAIRNSTAAWQFVFFHNPPYSYASSHSASATMRWPFQSWGADALFHGHNHNMQDMTANDPASGNTILPVFVQGAGGASRYSISGPPTLATGNWSNTTDFGFTMVTATETTARVEFYSTAGTLLHFRELTQIPVGSEPPPPPPPPPPPAVALTLDGYVQNFDGMGRTGTTRPPGFRHLTIDGSNSTWTTTIPASAVGGGTVAGALTAATPPTSNANNGLNAGFAATPDDRALGSAPTGNAGVAIELALVNDTPFNQPGIVISYDVDRFTAVSTANELPGYWLFYSLNGGVTWFEVTGLRPTLATMPNTVGTSSFGPVEVTFAGPWDVNDVLLLRWVDDNARQTSPDQIIGLDNLSIRAVVVPEPDALAAVVSCGVLMLRRRGR